METKTSETSKSILKNVLYGFSTWILPLGLSFAATPIIVGALGNDDYGIYALVLGFIGYSFNLNIGRAITKYIAEYRANGEIHKINDVITTTLFINILIGLIGVISICLLANWLVTDVFLIDADSQSKTVNAFYISSVIIFVTMLNQVFYSILQGLQRFDIYSKIFNVNSLSILIGNIVLAFSGFGLIALLVWNLFVLSIICIFVAVYSKKLLPDFNFSISVNGQILRQILKFSAGIIGYQVLGNFILLFERGWIIRTLGEETLTFYVVPMLLGINIHAFISSLLLVLFPLASSLNEKREKLQRLYLKATKVVCFLVAFMCVTLIVESKVFLTLWMGSDFAEKSWYLLILHVISFSLMAIKIVSWQLTEGLGHPNYNSLIFAVCLVFCLSFMVYLTDDYGSLGVAVGRLIGFGVLFLSVFHVEYWVFGKVQVKFWLKTIVMIGIAIVLAGSLEWLILTNLTTNWLALFVTTLSGGLTYCIVLWSLGFITEDEKVMVINLVRP